VDGQAREGWRAGRRVNQQKTRLRTSHWDFRLARKILSENFGASTRAGVRRWRFQLRRDQRFVLFLAATFKLSALVFGNAREFSFCREREAFTGPRWLLDNEARIPLYLALPFVVILGYTLWTLATKGA